MTSKKVPKIIFLIPIFSILASANLIREVSISNSISNHLSKLGNHVLDNYFSKSKCVFVITEGALDIRSNLNIPVVLVSVENLQNDTNAETVLIQALDNKCFYFIAQISNPVLFMALWTRAIYKTHQKSNPRIFFMPVIKDSKISVNIADLIYSRRETEITQYILTAEYESNNEEWPINLYTNNFNVPVGTPGRVGKVFLDRWNPAKGFLKNLDLFPDKMLNMNGKRLRVMTFDYVPYSHVDPLEGYEIKMILEFCKIYNCTLEAVDDGIYWGTIYENGTGDGLCGLVYTDKADFGAAAWYLWVKEFPFLDYSHSYLYSAVTLLVPKAVPLSGWRVPFLPFNITMWCIYAMSLILATIFMTFVTSATIKYTRFGNEVLMKKQFITLEDSAFRIIGMSVLQQPSIPLVPHTPIRHLFTSFELLYLILTTCYCSELSSFLTVPQFTKPVENIHDLSVTRLQWMGFHDGFVNSLRFVDDDPEIKTVVDNFHLQENCEILLEEASSGEIGVPIERCPGEHSYLPEETLEKLHAMNDNLFGSPVVIVLRKASPYTEKFDKLITLFLDSGLVLHWEQVAADLFLSTRKQLTMVLSKTTGKNHPPTNLSLSHVQGTFMIYASGVILSLVVFGLELRRGKETN